MIKQSNGAKFCRTAPSLPFYALRVVDAMPKGLDIPEAAYEPYNARPGLTGSRRRHRGLRGVKLVIADDHKGLRAAAAKVFHATLQRCRLHWMRNALAHVPAKQRPAVIAMVKTIFAQETADDVHAQWKTVTDALRERAPKLAELMDQAREDVLAYTAFPKEHWPQIASTNPLERLNGEIKRRSDVVGIFPNDRAVIRLVGALMLEQNDEWTVSRRYMSLESLAPISEDPLVRLPGVAA